MTLDLATLLPLYALDVLDDGDKASVERALAADPELRGEFDAWRASVHALLFALTPVVPPAYLAERLHAATGGGPFERFADRFAAMFDVAVDRARELLGWVHDPSKWHPATPGVALIHFRGGPAHAGADCGVIKIAPGTSFPWHAHNGEEVTLFLAGIGRDHTGALHVAGSDLVQAVGTAHEFTSIDTVDLVFAVRYRGVDFAAKRPADS